MTCSFWRWKSRFLCPSHPRFSCLLVSVSLLVSPFVCLCISVYMSYVSVSLCLCKGVFQGPVVPGDGKATASLTCSVGSSQYQHSGGVLGRCANGRRVPATTNEIRHAPRYSDLSVSRPASGCQPGTEGSYCHGSYHPTEASSRHTHSRYSLTTG